MSSRTRTTATLCFAFLVLVTGIVPVHATKVIYTCGPSKGYTYYLSGGLASKADEGWKEDGINSGIQLIFDDANSLDLVSLGEPPNDFRYSTHGCKITDLKHDSSELQVVAVCPQQIELFLFSFSNKVDLVRVDLASSAISKHGGAMHSVCKLGP
jgi:hypothetical protein